MSKLKHGQFGFALIEVVTAVAIISFSMLGIFSLLVFNQKIYLDTKNKFTGIMLSQEGAELVRNVRDSNWLAGLAFNDGLDPGSFSINPIISGQNIKDSIQSITDINDINAVLKYSGGVYRHDLGTDTIFSRAITIENIDEPGGAAVDGLKVTSLVQWTYRSITRQHSTVVFLYDWRQ